MPLTPPLQREAIHKRAIEIDGYRRADGQYDLEAHLTDRKTFGQTNYDRGFIPAGEPIHDMWLRLTINQTMEITAVEAVSDKTPYAMCPGAAPNFARLTGMRIKAGFLRDANHAVGGPIGCTHLRELLQQMATTAFQTINPARVKEDMRASGETEEHGSDKVDARIAERMGGAPKIINTCLAYADTGPLVRRRWPELYKGVDTAAGSRRRARMIHVPAFRQRPVSDGDMARFGGAVAEIGQDKDAHRAGPPSRMAGFFDLADQGAHVLTLPFADFEQRVPQLRLQPHAGPAASGDNVTIN